MPVIAAQRPRFATPRLAAPRFASPRFATPPTTVCVLRLSAIGDACHAAAALRALSQAWPDTRFTWIIGKLEARLMSAILPGTEFITFDKGSMSRELLRLRSILAGRKFELLLDLQLSIRASLVSTLVAAPIKLGFDLARARELQWLFTNARIAPAVDEHVLDSFMGFVRACGVEPGPAAWDLSLPPSALEYAERLIPAGRPTLVISPCSSHPARNWSAARYAAVADHAADVHDLRVILAGGRSAAEQRMGTEIAAATHAPLVNQIGRDTLPEMLGLLSKATALLSPDSGPVHMATMVGCPVLGLYAATRSARAGPYYSRQWCVDQYEAAALKVFGKPAAAIPWTEKIERPGVMDLIEVPAVTDKLDSLMAAVRAAVGARR
jgi:heptosyltransferase I